MWSSESLRTAHSRKILCPHKEPKVRAKVKEPLSLQHWIHWVLGLWGISELRDQQESVS